ncbi:MAG: hypothetical protein EHM13_10615 [Acidobacteria bacterium]|nr:MAG: hypothetical protein EHM13_10615 [Acidobacteriota bacterium]
MNRRLIPHLFAIAFALMLASACSDTGTPMGPSDPGSGGGGGNTGADVTITILATNGSQSFSPNPASIRAGQRVSWRNADSVAHTATANGGAFNTGVIAPGATSAPITINTTGNLAYHCTLHPEMVGSLTVNP